MKFIYRVIRYNRNIKKSIQITNYTGNNIHY